MDALQKHIDHAMTLIHDNNFSIANHIMKLLAKLQIALHVSNVLKENWYKTMEIILKVHSDLLSHFGINV